MAEYYNPFQPRRRVGALERSIAQTRARAEGIEAPGAEAPEEGLSPKQFQEQNIGRVQSLEDLRTLGQLKETGGPAVEEAKAFQRSQAAKQISLARGLGGGGRSLRMGTEAAGRSYAESQAPVAMVEEAARQGYTKEESAAAGLIAMNDAQFMQTMERVISSYRRQKELQKQQEEQQRKAGFWRDVGTGVSMGLATGNPLLAVAGGVAGGVKNKVFGKEGGVVPGSGNEDTVPAQLTPGEVVIPKELSAQLMEVMNRNVGGGREVYRAQAGGVVRRDPQTGYLMEDQTAMALQTMALLREQNERIEALEKGRK